MRLQFFSPSVLTFMFLDTTTNSGKPNQPECGVQPGTIGPTGRTRTAHRADAGQPDTTFGDRQLAQQ